ncbi:MAG: hypothetical protein V3U63_01660 [Gemmatimonadota bacterium]
MGSIEPRPSNSASTSDNVQVGMPTVEFARSLGGGVFAAFRDLGIVRSAAIAKELNLITLENAQSGISVVVREDVQRFESRLNIGVHDHGGENMQLIFASANRASIAAGVAAIVDEVVFLQADTIEWSDLANALVLKTPAVVADPAPITDEDVGTGDGTTGDTLGDFSLDFKPLVIGDVTSVTVAGVAFTPILGPFVSGNEVIITVGTGLTSGEMQFGVGGVAANVTGAILATYEPTHALVENTDYIIDYADGRIRVEDLTAASAPLRANQPVEVDYSHTTFDGESIEPFTQFVFAGRARVKLLTDIGINMRWTIPLVNLRLTDDEFTFNREEFQESQLSMTIVDDGTSIPFGTMEVFPESAA